MVGIYGEINPSEQSYDLSPGNLAWLGSEDIFKFSDKHLKICSATHDVKEEDMPAETEDGEALIWVCGEIVGFDDGREYRSKQKTHPNLTDSEYCASLYDRYGIDFVKGLNSNFAGVIYDRKKNFVTIFTDRLSARPVFFTESSKYSLLFSTSLQTIVNHPSFDHQFDMLGVQDFFTSGRVYGLRTVLEDVKQLHPAGILRYDLDSGGYSTEVYWRPKYEPKKGSFDDFVEKFYSIFKKVLFEQTQEDLDYGLMLSGGSDSRLIAGTIDKKIQCFHMNERMNVEAETAKTVAKRCGHDFRFLKRDVEYYPKALKRTSEISNLINWFEQGHTAGFVKELRRDSSCIINGQYADTVFGHYIPRKNIKIPLIGNLEVPVQEKYNSIAHFSRYGKHTRNSSLPSYLKVNKIKNSFPVNEKETNFFRISQESLESTIRGQYYPLTNIYTYLMYYTLNQTLPLRYPYLDNRIIDFSLKIPTKHLLKKDISYRTLSRYHNDLAKISHPTSGLPLSHPKLLHDLSKNYQDFLEKFSSSKFDVGTIADFEKIIRESEIIKGKFNEHSDLLEKCDFISKKKVWKVYQQHLEGKDKVNQLHPLLTFLENPMTKKIILSD